MSRFNQAETLVATLRRAANTFADERREILLQAAHRLEMQIANSQQFAKTAPHRAQAALKDVINDAKGTLRNLTGHPKRRRVSDRKQKKGIWRPAYGFRLSQK